MEDTDYSPLNSVFKLSHNLLAYEPKHMLSADFLYENYNPELIYNYLVDLMNPLNLVVMVGDKEF